MEEGLPFLEIGCWVGVGFVGVGVWCGCGYSDAAAERKYVPCATTHPYYSASPGPFFFLRACHPTEHHHAARRRQDPMGDEDEAQKAHG